MVVACTSFTGRVVVCLIAVALFYAALSIPDAVRAARRVRQSDALFTAPKAKTRQLR